MIKQRILLRNSKNNRKLLFNVRNVRIRKLFIIKCKQDQLMKQAQYFINVQNVVFHGKKINIFYFISFLII